MSKSRSFFFPSQGPLVCTDKRAEALDLAGTHTWEDVKQGIAEGRFQQWGDDECGIVTEVLKTPLRVTLLFWLAWGDLRGLYAMVPPILQWGRQQHCTHASFVGRFGWLRTFVRDFGFKEVATCMEMTL